MNKPKNNINNQFSTWCSSEIKAAIILEEILNKKNDRKLSKKVNVCINKFYVRRNSLNNLKETERMYFLEFLLHDTRKKIKNNFNDEIQSYLCNIVTALYKKKLNKG